MTYEVYTRFPKLNNIEVVPYDVAIQKIKESINDDDLISRIINDLNQYSKVGNR